MMTTPLPSVGQSGRLKTRFGKRKRTRAWPPWLWLRGWRLCRRRAQNLLWFFSVCLLSPRIFRSYYIPICHDYGARPLLVVLRSRNSPMMV